MHYVKCIYIDSETNGFMILIKSLQNNTSITDRYQVVHPNRLFCKEMHIYVNYWNL